MRWAAPQVLVPLLALLAAGLFALRAGPPPVAPPPELASTAPPDEEVERREVVLYLVDDELARPVVRQVAGSDDPSLRLQALVDELRAVLVEEGAWPEALPSPRVFAFEVERAAAAVLDLPAHDLALDVGAERRIVASLQRTLLEAGVERAAFLRDGRADASWLGRLMVPSSLE